MKKLFLVFLFFLTGFSQAQIVSLAVWRTKIDSLASIIKSSSGTRRVDELNELSRYIVLLDADSSLHLARQALAFARAIDYPEGKGAAILNLGNYFYYTDNKLKALQQYFASQLLLEPTEPSRYMGYLMYHMGMLNSYLMNYDRTKTCFSRALSNLRAVHDSAAIIDVLFYNWGVYIGVPEARTDRAMPLEKDSAFICNEIILNYLRRHSEMDHWGWNNFYCSNRKGMFYLDHKDPRALGVYESTYELVKKKKRPVFIALALINLGVCYSDIYHDDRKALQYYMEALKESKKITDLFDESYPEIQTLLAKIYIKRKDYKRAEECLLKARRYVDEALGNKEGMKTNLHARLYYVMAMKERRIEVDSLLSLAYRSKGDYRKSLIYNNSFYQGRDSLLMDKTSLKVSLLQSGMEVENERNRSAIFARESRVKALELTRTRLISGITAILIAVTALLLISYFRRKRLKSEQKAIAIEQKLLRSQMNPHFIFNSLASIQNFIYKEKREDAGEYLSRFSKLVRNILENSREEYVPLEKEIETISHYLELQKLRYSGRFEYAIVTDPGIDADNTWIPPMLAQPFIENSIEHGIKYKETPGHINIRFKLESQMIRFEVEDDGVGREKAKEIEFRQNNKHKPLATSITQERLAAINKKLRTKIRMEIIDLEDGLGMACGTRVTFGIPVIIK
jgi:sensor histidine kinase YesM